MRRSDYRLLDRMDFIYCNNESNVADRSVFERWVSQK